MNTRVAASAPPKTTSRQGPLFPPPSHQASLYRTSVGSTPSRSVRKSWHNSPQDGRALERLEVALARLRVPATPLAGQTEQIASVGIEAVEIRFIGDQRLEIVQRLHDHPPCGDVVLIAVFGRKFEERRRRKVAGPRQVIGVVLEADPVRWVELLRRDRPTEPGPFLRGVIHPVKARLPGVHLDPIVVGASAGTSQG